MPGLWLDGEDVADDPVVRLVASENANWVRAGVKELSARQREILLLKYFEDLSCRQIGEKIGIAESTVQRHLVDARKRLRQVLLRLRDNADE